jgi:hypothetical protein
MSYWRVLGSAFTLAAVAIVSLFAWDWLRPMGPVQQETQRHTYPQPITRIVFSGFEASDIDVTGGAGSTVEIVRELRWMSERPRFTEVWEGQTLRISHACGDVDDDECSVGYRVSLAAGVQVRAETSSGDVGLRGITGPVDLETVSGDISLAGTGGETTVKTVSGEVAATGLTAAHARVTSVSGHVRLTCAAAPQELVVRTNSGDATVRVPTGGETYRVAVSTTSGEQRVGVEQSSSAERSIQAETTSGDVVIGY